MTLKEKIKSRMIECTKQGLSFERDLLRVVLGEVQRKELKIDLDDDGVVRIIKKMRDDNSETMKAITGERADVLRMENEVLGVYIPQVLSVDDIIKELQPIADQIRDAKGDGLATGVSMKFLKSAGLSIEGKDVSLAVKEIRK